LEDLMKIRSIVASLAFAAVAVVGGYAVTGRTAAATEITTATAAPVVTTAAPATQAPAPARDFRAVLAADPSSGGGVRCRPGTYCCEQHPSGNGKCLAPAFCVTDLKFCP
jgi:hypothetical protein